MSQPLDGIRILDFTHVQSGPTCTQLLAWMGADVIKVERPGVGDATRNQLVDVEGADSLYFTMLNHNKRSLTLNSKTEAGKEVLEKLVKKSHPKELPLLMTEQYQLKEVLYQLMMKGCKVGKIYL